MTVIFNPSPVNGEFAPTSVDPGTPQWRYRSDIGAWDPVRDNNQPSGASVFFGPTVYFFGTVGIDPFIADYIFTKV